MREQMRKRRKELGTSNPSLKVGLEIKKVLQTSDDSIFDNEDEESKETEYG